MYQIKFAFRIYDEYYVASKGISDIAILKTINQPISNQKRRLKSDQGPYS